MKTRIIAVVVGILVAMVLVGLVEWIGHRIYAVSVEGLDMNDREAVAAFVAQMPFGAKLSVVIAWLIGAFGGSLVAGLIEKEKGLRIAMTITTLIWIFGVMNFFMVPHPFWMWLASLFTFPAGWLGYRLVKK